MEMKYRNENLEPYIEGEAYFYIDARNHKYWHNAQGQIHRENGPAIEWADGNKGWCIEGTNYSEEEYEAALEVYCAKVGKKSIFTLQREAEEKYREYWRTVEMPGEYSGIEL